MNKKNQYRAGEANPDQFPLFISVTMKSGLGTQKNQDPHDNFRSRLGTQENQHEIWIGNTDHLMLIQHKKIHREKSANLDHEINLQKSRPATLPPRGCWPPSQTRFAW
jgi:hypothetical protein